MFSYFGTSYKSLTSRLSRHGKVDERLGTTSRCRFHFVGITCYYSAAKFSKRLLSVCLARAVVDGRLKSSGLLGWWTLKVKPSGFENPPPLR